jgi:hypothetical protein
MSGNGMITTERPSKGRADRPPHPASSQSQRAAWATYLQTMDWDFAADLSFRWPVSTARARRAVTQWVRGISSRAFAAVILAKGRVEGRLHCHVLLGGIGRRPRPAVAIRLVRWRYGWAALTPYSPRSGPRGGMIRYRVVVQDCDPNEITLVGEPLAYRPRLRRR